MKKTIAVLTLSAASAALSGCGAFYPPYRAWEQEQAGKARLAEARSSTLIKVEQAKANLESAKLNAQAEIERARGTDMANRIMAESLGGPENYLRWSYIDMLRDTAGKGERQIFVATEAGIPILHTPK